MSRIEENARLAKSLHEALPASAIASLCAHIANVIEHEWQVPASRDEVETALWEWVRLSKLNAERHGITV